MIRFFILLASVCLFVVPAPFSHAQSSPEGERTYLAVLLDRSVVFDTTSLAVSHAHADPAEAWKHWHTVDNFSFGKNRGSLPMIADIDALHPYFKAKVEQLIDHCLQAGIKLAIVESYRTTAKQAEYFAMGSKYTSTPGGKSRHQYGLAVDVVPLVDSVAVWDNPRLWRKIGAIGERLGLRWGGRWKVLYDPGHFEWVGGLSRYQLAKGQLPRIPASQAHLFPKLEDDLKLLQTYWQAWQVEQSVTARKTAALRNGKAAGIGN